MNISPEMVDQWLEKERETYRPVHDIRIHVQIPSPTEVHEDWRKEELESPERGVVVFQM
jgi:hypothetical protein